MRLDQSIDQLFFKLFVLIVPKLVFQTSTDARFQLVEGGAFPMVFGKFIIKRRQDLLLNLADDDGKIYRFAGDFFIRIVFRVIHRDGATFAQR